MVRPGVERLGNLPAHQHHPPVITRWLNQGTDRATGIPPTTPILIVTIDYGYAGWETVIYVDVESGL